MILPGLIDLHGHPEYNVCSPRGSRPSCTRTAGGDFEQYEQIVKLPLAAMKAARSLEKTLSRYAEARALVTGTTAIQGANGKFSNLDDRWSAMSTGGSSASTRPARSSTSTG